jgi:hypothetical protein
MRPQKYYTKGNWDVIVYGALFVLLILYGVYIKGTCEELGCLAIIIPIIGIMVISVIEFIYNVWVYSHKYHFTTERKIVSAISGTIAAFTLLLLLLSVTK